MTKGEMEKGTGWGDTRKAAEVIYEVVGMEDRPFRLLLGSNALAQGKQFCEERLREMTAWEKFSRMTDRQRMPKGKDAQEHLAEIGNDLSEKERCHG